jgi:phosphoribosylformimino-5-aminoimidazole carboxamide ribotide isomerase
MFEIIPAIDLMGGKCVRLAQGDFSRKTVYGRDPLDAALRFEQAGLNRLHVVDLDGAKRGAVTNLKTVESLARNTKLIIDFGGGIKTADELRSVFEAGAAMASIGSIAVKSPDEFRVWVETYGSQKFLLGADVRGGCLAVDGWQTATDLEVTRFLSGCANVGIRSTFVTDVAKDGLLQGPSIELYRRILTAVPQMNLIASGGVSGVKDIVELVRIGCSGVIVGKAIYEGRITLDELAGLQRKLSAMD